MNISRALAVGIAISAIAVTLLDHFHGHSTYLGGLNTAETRLPLPPPEVDEEPPPALARGVTVIFLDGLSFEAASSLEALGSAAAEGVSRPLAVDFPSFTYPGLIALSTGVPPRYSGLRLNHLAHAVHLAHVPLPSLMDVASRANIPVRISSGGWGDFHALLDFNRSLPEVSLEELLAARGDGPGLDWIYFGEIDEAGHDYGGASEEYRAAAGAAAQLVARVLGATDLSKDAVVVVSDHGHLPRGGHGGDELEVRRAFFLAVGAGIRAAGDLELRSNLDVAPTIAALLGLAPPGAGLGRPMMDILTAPGDHTARALAPAFAQRVALESQLTPSAALHQAPRLLAALRGGDSAAVPSAERFLDELAAEREVAYEAERDARAIARLLLALPVVVFLLGVVFCLHRSGRLPLSPRDLLPTGVYSAIFLALYYLAGYGISWSIPRGEPGFLLETFLYGAIAATGALLLRWKLRAPERLAQETLVMTTLFGLPYLLVSAWVGLDPAYLSGPRMSFLVVFLATMGFYAHGPFGIALLVRALRQPRRAKALTDLEAAPFLVRERSEA